jgi:hypothetical protein
MADLLLYLVNCYNLTVAVLIFTATCLDFFRFWGFEDIIIDLYPNDPVYCSLLLSIRDVSQIIFLYILTFCRGVSVILAMIETVGSPTIIEQVPLLKSWFGRGLLYLL